MPESPGSELKFLLIYPDELFFAPLCNYLEELGHKAHFQALSIGEALVRLNQDMIDFIICDWNMPGGSTLGFLKLVKSQSKFSHVAFLITSIAQENEGEKIRKAAAARVDRYLLMPFAEAAFKKCVLEILAERKMIKDKPLS